MYVCLYTCHGMCVAVRVQLCGISSLLSLLSSFRDVTQVTRLALQVLYLLSHLADPCVTLIYTLV